MVVWLDGLHVNFLNGCLIGFLIGLVRDCSIFMEFSLDWCLFGCFFGQMEYSLIGL